MYIEIKTDHTRQLVKTFEETISKGQQAMLTLGKDGDFWSLSINTTVMQTPNASGADAP